MPTAKWFESRNGLKGPTGGPTMAERYKPEEIIAKLRRSESDAGVP